MVECQLPKLKVASSILVARSKKSTRRKQIAEGRKPKAESRKLWAA
jgi:hypothetical protein